MQPLLPAVALVVALQFTGTASAQDAVDADRTPLIQTGSAEPGAPAVDLSTVASDSIESSAEAASTQDEATEVVSSETSSEASDIDPAVTTGDDASTTDASAIETPPAFDPGATAIDPSLPPPAELPVTYDPWEKLNRRTHRFNNAIDRSVARPLAKAYVKAVPRPIRLGVSNFFSNLGQPISAVNSLLQGKPTQASQALGRFLLNATLGIGGIFDPATSAKLPNKSEDFGQTLGKWGWKRSRYLELPLFGPRTVRDTFGLLGDSPLSPIRGIENDRWRVGLQSLQLVDVRMQLLSVDSMREGVADDYTLLRDAWMQRRDYQIFGESHPDGALPDYLLDEENPTVPVDAMPIMPTDP